MSAVVLAGVELLTGQPAQTIAPLGSLPKSAVITLTRATLLVTRAEPRGSTPVQILVRSTIAEDQSIVLCSLSSSSPTCALQLTFHADSEPTFELEVSPSTAAAAANGAESSVQYSVHLSGFIELQAEEDEMLEDEELDSDDELDIEELDEDDEEEEEEHEHESHAIAGHANANSRAVQNSKRSRASVASLDEEDEDDDRSAAKTRQEQLDEDDEDEDEPAVKQPAKKVAKVAAAVKSSNTPASTATPAPAPVATAAAAANAKKAAAAKPQPQTQRHANGLLVTDEVVGAGPVATKGKNVSIRYKGELMDGRVFDTNLPRGKPFQFRLGAGECIAGFDLGVVGMKVGGRRVLVIPAALGYGKQGSPPSIPPNAVLKFTVELIKA